MNDISDADNGTIRNPFELASSTMKDGRTLIQTIYEDGEVRYLDFSRILCYYYQYHISLFDLVFLLFMC